MHVLAFKAAEGLASESLQPRPHPLELHLTPRYDTTRQVYDHQEELLIAGESGTADHHEEAVTEARRRNNLARSSLFPPLSCSLHSPQTT